MPLIVPSHQAAVLPFKLWRPAAFSGLGLVLGSVAPDLEFILRLDRDWLVSHTFAAQIYFTIPLVLVLHALLTRLVLPFLVPQLPAGAPFYFEALAALRPLRAPRDVLVASWSAALGGLTHVMLDGITHGNQSGWALAYLPGLATQIPHPFGPVPLHDALQLWLSLFLAIGSVQTWQWLACAGQLHAWSGEPKRQLASIAPRLRRRTFRFLAFTASAGAVVAPTLRRPDSLFGGLELALFGAIAFLFYGLVVAAAADRALRALPRRRLARLRPVLALAFGE